MNIISKLLNKIINQIQDELSGANTSDILELIRTFFFGMLVVALLYSSYSYGREVQMDTMDLVVDVCGDRYTAIVGMDSITLTPTMVDIGIYNGTLNISGLDGG